MSSMSSYPEELPPQEGTPQPYTLSARYPDLPSSAQPYLEARDLIYQHEHLALSAFRLQLRRLEEPVDDWFVTILGEEPPLEYQQQFRRILSTGEEMELPREVVDALLKRRAASTKVGRWVERHYRPGGQRRLP